MASFEQFQPRTLPETNDCVVRALCKVFDRQYADVHAACAQAGRRYGRGMVSAQITTALQILTGKKDARLWWASMAQDIGIIGTSVGNWRSSESRPTLAQFAKNRPRGRYLVITKGHAIAMVDGKFYDDGKQGLRTRVWMYFDLSDN